MFSKMRMRFGSDKELVMAKGKPITLKGARELALKIQRETDERLAEEHAEFWREPQRKEAVMTNEQIAKTAADRSWNLMLGFYGVETKEFRDRAKPLIEKATLSAIAEAAEAKGLPLIPMPEGVTLHNGQGHNTPCDMLHGPCACGAWHGPKEIVAELWAENAELRRVIHMGLEKVTEPTTQRKSP